MLSHARQLISFSHFVIHRLISQSRLIKVDIIIIETTAIQPEAFRDNNYDDGQMNDDLNNNGEIAD